MADMHSHSKKGTSVVPFILAAFVLLSILYLLAKGCTNSDTEHPVETAGHAKHASVAPTNKIVTNNLLRRYSL